MFFLILVIIKCLSQLLPLYLIIYVIRVMSLRPLDYYTFLIISVRLYISESDVCRRQILTSKHGPRTGRVNFLRQFYFSIDLSNSPSTLYTKADNRMSQIADYKLNTALFYRRWHYNTSLLDKTYIYLIRKQYRPLYMFKLC